MVRPRDVAGLTVGALVAPVAHELAMRLLGRHSLDPTIRKEKP